MPRERRGGSTPLSPTGFDGRRPRMRPLINSSARRDAWIVLGLIILAVGVPAVAGIASGAISVPRNDDFAYRRAAITLYETGRLELTGWAVMMLVGQLLATVPLAVDRLAGAPGRLRPRGPSSRSSASSRATRWPRRLLSPWLGRIRRAACGPSPGIHGLHDVLHDRGARPSPWSCRAWRSGPRRSIDRRRSIAGAGWPPLSRSGAMHSAIREYAIAAPIAVLVAAAASDRQGRQAPIRHRARRDRGRRAPPSTRTHRPCPARSSRGRERAHAGDHPDAILDAVASALARPRAGAPGRRDELGPALVAIRRSARRHRRSAGRRWPPRRSIYVDQVARPDRRGSG